MERSSVISDDKPENEPENESDTSPLESIQPNIRPEIQQETQQETQPEIQHGTNREYRKGCRCEACKVAARAAWKERRLKKGKIPRPAAQHGTRSKYVAGCRCSPCTAANNEYIKSWSRLNRAGISMNDPWIEEMLKDY